MGALTARRPKPLLTVRGKPLLAHALDAVAPVVDRAVVVVGYHGERVRDRFGQAYGGLELTYVEQPEQRGLADALLQAEDAVDGPFVHLNADNVFGPDPGGAANVRRLVERRRSTDADAVLLVERVPRAAAQRTGVVVTAGDKGDEGSEDSEGDTDSEGADGARVTGVVEKPAEPPSRLVQTGSFAFRPTVFAACRRLDRADTGEFELSDAISLLAREGRVETVRLRGWRRNVNTPRDRAAVEARLRRS